MDHPMANDVNCPSSGPPQPPPPTSPPSGQKPTPETPKTFSPSVNSVSESLQNGLLIATKSTKTSLPLPSVITLPTSNGNPGSPESALPAPSKRPLVDPEDDTKSALKEMFLPVMLSGFGNMGAGMILERVQFMEIFMAIPQLIQLVPPLLGLKGNVEMTLASRLSTHANLGHLSDKVTRRRIIIGNIALCQFLATGVGFIAPIIALLLSHFSITGHSGSPSVSLSPPTVNDGHSMATALTGSASASGGATSSMVTFDVDSTNDFANPVLTKSLLVVAIFLATSGLADVILSSIITCVVIVSSQILGINSDNVATPIAASVGDLMTMCFLVYVSSGLYKLTTIISWAPTIPLIIWTIIVIFTGIIARRNPFTRSIVFQGWSPLVVSMLLQNISGIVMESSLRQFPRMAIYQPIINGFGGNLVAIQSSRVATYLHKHAPKRELVNESDACCHSPFHYFFGKGQHGKLAFLMVLLAGPIQLPLVLISTLLSPTSQITVAQLLTYYVCATIQVVIILYIGYCFVNLLWIFGANPDDNAIPILTALADLLGTIILVMGYMFLASIGDTNATRINDGNIITPQSLSSIVYNATNFTNGNTSTIVNSFVDYSQSTNSSISSTTTTLSPLTSLSTTTISSQLTSTPSTIASTILSTTLAPITTTTISKLTDSLIANLTRHSSSTTTTIKPTLRSANITF